MVSKITPLFVQRTPIAKTDTTANAGKPISVARKETLTSRFIFGAVKEYLIRNSQFFNDLVFVHAFDDADDSVSTDVVRLDVQQLQRLVF